MDLKFRHNVSQALFIFASKIEDYEYYKKWNQNTIKHY